MGKNQGHPAMKLGVWGQDAVDPPMKMLLLQCMWSDHSVLRSLAQDSHPGIGLLCVTWLHFDLTESTCDGKKSSASKKLRGFTSRRGERFWLAKAITRRLWVSHLNSLLKPPIYILGMMILSWGSERLKEKKWVVCLEQTRHTVSVLPSNCGCNKLPRT